MKTTKLVIQGLTVPKTKEYHLTSPQRRKRQNWLGGFEGTETERTSIDFSTMTKTTKLVMEGLRVHKLKEHQK